jgi:hypothetical protein
MKEPFISDYEILGDSPVVNVDDDVLDFSEFVHPLAVRLIKSKNQTPFTVGVFANWGSGKTSIMRILQRMLQQDDCFTVWFEPWKYNEGKDVWKGLVTTLSEQVAKNDALLKEVKRKRKSLTKGVAKFIFSSVFGKAGPSLVDAITEEPWSAKLLHDFEKAIDNLLESLRALQTSNKKEDRPMVLFIDDLDRCMPSTVLAVLQAVKLVLNRADLIVVMGISEEEVINAVRASYAKELEGIEVEISDDWGRKYLRKMFQYPFYVPPVAKVKKQKYVIECMTKSKVVQHLDILWADIIVESCDNLREVKWLINRFISETDKTFANFTRQQTDADFVADIEAPRALFILLIAYSFPGYFQQILMDHQVYYTLQDSVFSHEEAESKGHDADKIMGFMTHCLSPQSDHAPLVNKFDPDELRFYLIYGSELHKEQVRQFSSDEELDFFKLEVGTFRYEGRLIHESEFLDTEENIDMKKAELVSHSTFNADGDANIFSVPDLTQAESDAHNMKLDEARSNQKKAIEAIMKKHK